MTAAEKKVWVVVERISHEERGYIDVLLGVYEDGKIAEIEARGRCGPSIDYGGSGSTTRIYETGPKKIIVREEIIRTSSIYKL